LSIILVRSDSLISEAISAIRSGAIDFLENCCRPPEFIEAVIGAVTSSKQERIQNLRRKSLRDRLKKFTEREHPFYDAIVASLTINLSFKKLGIIESTVEFHRANVKKKLDVETYSNLLELKRLVKSLAGGCAATIQFIFQRLFCG